MRSRIDSHADRYEMARTGTRGLERKLRKRSELRDREAAKAYEAAQPWASRVVRRECTGVWWCWFLRPVAR